MKRVLLIIAVSGLCSTLSFAQERVQRVDERQISQRLRIHLGREKGKITRREAAALNREQKQLRRAEHAARSDGRMSRHECRRLELSQDRANRRIHYARTNSAVR
jgi:hypothetical protein